MSPKDSYWIRRYELPNVRVDGFSQGWGIIVLDSKGFLSIISDYGNYSYHWSSFGNDFADFILGCDHGYLYRKFGVKDIYDEDATLKKVKSTLKSYFKGKASKLKEELAQLSEFSELGHLDDFGRWLYETDLPDAHECCQMRGHPQYEGFAKHIWPRFKELLRAEYPRVISTKVSSFQKHLWRVRPWKRSLPRDPVLVREARPSRPSSKPPTP